MSDTLIPVPSEWKRRAYIDPDKYEGWYLDSVARPEAFWGEEGNKLQWIKPFTRVTCPRGLPTQRRWQPCGCPTIIAELAGRQENPFIFCGPFPSKIPADCLAFSQGTAA